MHYLNGPLYHSDLQRNYMDEQIEDLYEMLLLIKEGLFHVKNDTPIQRMRPLYKACPPPNK